jgi:hypothetical protein
MAFLEVIFKNSIASPFQRPNDYPYIGNNFYSKNRLKQINKLFGENEEFLLLK